MTGGPLLLVAAALALLPSAPAVSQTLPASQPQNPPVEIAPLPAGVDETTQTEDVRFRSDGRERMTVGVMVRGTGPYRFVVDTGADHTVVSSDLAARLQMATTGTAQLHSIAGVSSVRTTAIPTLQLTRKVVRNLVAPVLGASDIGADGILGLDSLRSQRLVLDFQSNTMSVVPSVLYEAPSRPDEIIVEGHRRNGRLMITDAEIQGIRVAVIIDTGSEVTVGNDVLKAALFKKRPTSLFRPVQLQSVTGQTLAGEATMVDKLAIGGAGLGNLSVVFVDAHIFDQLRLNRKPALLLGMDAMRAFKKVAIDFAAQKLRVFVPQHSALEIRFARL